MGPQGPPGPKGQKGDEGEAGPFGPKGHVVSSPRSGAEERQKALNESKRKFCRNQPSHMGDTVVGVKEAWPVETDQTTPRSSPPTSCSNKERQTGTEPSRTLKFWCQMVLGSACWFGNHGRTTNDLLLVSGNPGSKRLSRFRWNRGRKLRLFGFDWSVGESVLLNLVLLRVIQDLLEVQVFPVKMDVMELEETKDCLGFKDHKGPMENG